MSAPILSTPFDQNPILKSLMFHRWAGEEAKPPRCWSHGSLGESVGTSKPRSFLNLASFSIFLSVRTKKGLALRRPGKEGLWEKRKVITEPQHRYLFDKSFPNTRDFRHS